VLFDYPSPPSHIVTHTTGMAHLKVIIYQYYVTTLHVV